MDKQDAKVVGQGLVYGVLLFLLVIVVAVALGIGVRLFLWTAFA